jgi:DNA polymerase-1
MAQHPSLIALIDGHSLAFRAYYALAKVNLQSSRGEPTSAVFGFAQILLTMIQTYSPTHIALSFDVGRTFRHDLFEEYKAGRKKPGDDFYQQVERIKELATTFHIPIYTAEGYEADDVIGTLARQAAAEGLSTYIITGDADTLQLVDEQTSVVLTEPRGRKMLNTLYDEQKVRERYDGLSPAQLTDLRGLQGDSSDRIPGVKGIGAKGAVALLKQFGTVETLFEQLDEAPPRYQKLLDGQREQALLSKHLATIVCDVPVALDTECATFGTYSRPDVIRLFQELEFVSLVEKLPTPPAESPHTTPSQGDQLSFFDADDGSSTASMSSNDPPSPNFGTYHAVTTQTQLDEVVAAITDAPGFAFDTESSGLNPFQCDLVGISIAVKAGEAWYIPLGHETGEQLPRERVLDTLRPFFGDAERPKYAHNAKFDIEMLLQAGVEVRGVTFDTMIAAGLLSKRMRLKDLAFYELHISEPMTNIEELIGRGAKQRSFAAVPIDQAAPYAAADADMTLRLVEALKPQLAAHEQLHTLFSDVEMPLLPILVEMERAGIWVDVGYLRTLSTQLQERLQTYEQDIYNAAGKPFNINSGPQLNEVLFDILGLPTDGLRKTSTGRYSLTAGVLEKMRDEHEIVQLILDYRQLAKIKSTYADSLANLVHSRTHRIHTSFNQMGTLTGRLASSSPNLQNIPVRTQLGNEIRRAFVAPEGHVFLAADYSQIELRVLAHISEDEHLIRAFQEGQDIHTATAAQLFRIPIEEVDKQQRRIAKTTVFGIIYGISSFGLAQRTDLTRSEAQFLIDSFFEQFPGVRVYMDSTLAGGRTNGYVESLFGRRRYFPDLTTGSYQHQQAAEREAINTPIQATAADLMKMAMIAVSRAIAHHRMPATMVLQVHDELMFEVPREAVEEVHRVVRDAMETVYTLRVPLQVDVEVGNHWEHMEALRP